MHFHFDWESYNLIDNIFYEESKFEKNFYHPKHFKGGPTRFGVYY